MIGVYGFWTLGFRVWRGEIADWDMGLPKIWGTFLGGPYNKDYNIVGLYIGVPLFWETSKYIGCIGVA